MQYRDLTLAAEGVGQRVGDSVPDKLLVGDDVDESLFGWDGAHHCHNPHAGDGESLERDGQYVGIRDVDT
jgi:hypothetical protein